MIPEEADKIIAEYMGDRLWSGNETIIYKHDIYIDHNGEKFIGNFLQSLDALVPVWEKLDNATSCAANIMFKYSLYEGKQSCCIDFYPKPKYSILLKGIGETRQQAAAIATAKAIKELSNE